MDRLEKTVRAQYRALTKTLIAEKRTVALMESATGGQLVSLLTDTEGSSAVVRGAVVTYTNAAKERFGVSKAAIDAHSVYSNEVSREMALRSRALFSADIGIGVTGTTGNVDPANPDASVPGEVFFSIAYAEGVRNYAIRLEPQRTRLACKLLIAQHVGDALQRVLNGEERVK